MKHSWLLIRIFLLLFLTSNVLPWSGGTIGGGGGGGGTGDVTGPSSSLDNSIPTFNLTSGKIIQDPAKAFINSDSLDVLLNNFRILDGTCDAGVVGRTTICNNGGVLSARHGTGILISLEAGAGAAATFVEDEFIPSASQTVFMLSATYVGANGLTVVGLNTAGGYAEGTHYTISGTTFTWLDNPFTLDGVDRLVVKFQTN